MVMAKLGQLCLPLVQNGACGCNLLLISSRPPVRRLSACGLRGVRPTWNLSGG